MSGAKNFIIICLVFSFVKSSQGFLQLKDIINDISTSTPVEKQESKNIIHGALQQQNGENPCAIWIRTVQVENPGLSLKVLASGKN